MDSFEQDLQTALENADGYVDQINQKASYLRAILNGTVGPEGQDRVTMINKLIDSPITSIYMP